MEAILKATGLKKYYGKGEALVKALDGVDLEIERGKFTAIIGTSGSGKSTLLNMLGGLDTPSQGSIQIGNTELAKLNSEQATIFRRNHIGFIFQNYNLVPVLSVWENIVFPISLDGRRPDEKFIMESRSSACLAWRRSWTACPTISPADSSREWPLPGRWPLSLPLSWRTNPPATWTPKPVTM